MHFSQSGLVKLWSFVSFYLVLVHKHCIYFNVVSLCRSLKHFDAIIISICVVYSYHGYRSHIDYIDRCLQLQHERPATVNATSMHSTAVLGASDIVVLLSFQEKHNYVT